MTQKQDRKDTVGPPEIKFGTGLPDPAGCPLPGDHVRIHEARKVTCRERSHGARALAGSGPEHSARAVIAGRS